MVHPLGSVNAFFLLLVSCLSNFPNYHIYLQSDVIRTRRRSADGGRVVGWVKLTPMGGVAIPMLDSSLRWNDKLWCDLINVFTKHNTQG